MRNACCCFEIKNHAISIGMKTPQNIIVVDDEVDLVELVSYNLKKEGFSVDSASDGESALKKIKKGKYDLLILDLMLPGIQGMELCRISY